jgi:hypothetical protein
MPSLLPVAQALALCVLLLCGLPALPAQSQSEAQTAASILAQVREATGGEAWNHVAEFRAEGTMFLGGKEGTFQYTQDLLTGANVVRAQLPALDVKESHATEPAQDWEQDNFGYVKLTPGGKNAGEIDDLYISSSGWWRPNFGGASVSLLPQSTSNGSTCDLLQFKVPGGSRFTLWINRGTHYIERIANAESATYLSDYRRVEGGLVLPFRKQVGTTASTPVLITTKLTVLPEVNEADFQPPFSTDYTIPASGQVTVPAEGGLIFEMKINGQGPFHTIFDTGAVNVVSSTLAKRLGLKIEEKPVPFGAIGGALTVHMAHVDTLTIGDLVVRDQSFYVLDIPSDAGDPTMIVGWEIMRRFAVRVDFEHNQLTFFDGPHFHYTGTGAMVPLILHKDSNNVEVAAQADGIPGIFTLDTGNQVGLFFNSGFVEEHHLVAGLGAHFRGYNGRGFGGPSPEAWFARLHTLRMGDAEVANAVVRLQTQPDGPNANAGNIGQSILNRFTITVDCMRGVMYLEKNANWAKPEVFNRAGLILDTVDGAESVMTVLPGSSGEAAGLKLGDKITAINGQPLSDDPNDPVFTQPTGTVLHITIRRDGALHVYDVTLREVL